jgi:hypothetical protein
VGCGWPPPQTGRHTDQRKGTRSIFLGRDRGCGQQLTHAAQHSHSRSRAMGVLRCVCRLMIFVPSGDANEPGHDDGGPGQGSLSCLTVSRKGTPHLFDCCIPCISHAFITSQIKLQTLNLDACVSCVLRGLVLIIFVCDFSYQIADKQIYNNDPGIGSPGERVRRPAQHPDLRGVRCAPTVP